MVNEELDVPALLAEIKRLVKTINYINDLSSEFFSEVEVSEWDNSKTYSIPDNPHKPTMQEIFVVSHEAVSEYGEDL